jgi:hypothetical protein
MHQEHVQSTAATQPLLPDHEDLEPAKHPTTTALAPTPVTQKPPSPNAPNTTHTKCRHQPEPKHSHANANADGGTQLPQP